MMNGMCGINDPAPLGLYGVIYIVSRCFAPGLGVAPPRG